MFSVREQHVLPSSPIPQGSRRIPQEFCRRSCNDQAGFGGVGNHKNGQTLARQRKASHAPGVDSQGCGALAAEIRISVASSWNSPLQCSSDRRNNCLYECLSRVAVSAGKLLNQSLVAEFFSSGI